jgi:formamidopyrimidine-DNA glycosylase
MPELPDLQVFSYNLDKRLKGKTVASVIVGNGKKLNVTKTELQEAIEQQKLKKVYRKGKELYVEFGNKNVLALHLMLNGELHLSEEGTTFKSIVIRLLFTDGLCLTLTDFRGLAKVTLNPPAEDIPDATAIDYELLKQITSTKKAAIKNILLDQKYIGGIGNAYADEILWEAGISPFSIARMIPDHKLKDLTKSIKVVLANAEKQILKTHPDSISGEVRDFLKIHSPRKTHSPSGIPIKVQKTGARKTYYTEEQELFS